MQKRNTSATNFLLKIRNAVEEKCETVVEFCKTNPDRLRFYGTQDEMTFYVVSLFSAVVMFATSLSLIHLGGRIRRSKGEDHNSQINATSYSAIEAGLFGLFGLLLAFTFSGAVTRFDERRQAIVTEANAISAAYRNVDLLPAGAKEQVRATMRSYLAARIAAQRQPRGLIETRAATADLSDDVERLQSSLWNDVMAARNAATAGSTDAIDQVLLPSMNESFSIARSRAALSIRHPPLLIYAALFTLAALCSLISGYAMGTSGSRIHALSFAASLALGLYLTLEIEFPRQGLVTLDRYDDALTHALGN